MIDYEKVMKDMLLDVCQDFNKEKYAAFTRACGLSLAESLALIQSREGMTGAMTMMFSAISEHASECWQTLHDQQEQDGMTAEEFLREHFNPEHKND